MNPFDYLVEALEHFFRRRPPLAALMWHPENKAAGETFTVPTGKIYEVRATEGRGSPFLINGIAVELMAALYEWLWADQLRPINMNVAAYWNGAAEVAFFAGNADPRGWIMTENQVLSVGDAGTFTVWWRDVTHLQ